MALEATTLVALFGVLALAAVLALLAALSRKGRTEDEARAYLAGFTYVLSDDPDAAIAELSRAAQLNRQTLETYFALGALFRRKGELSRAIRLHCNILLRAGLAPEVRRRAQLALALDYKRSGLRDKAAETLEKLLEDDPNHRDGLVHCRQILEGLGDWPRAIELQSRLIKLEGGGEQILAHLLAEAARAQLATGGTEAEEYARQGARIGPACADAMLAQGEIRVALGRPADAREPICAALMLEPELAPKAIHLLSQAFAVAGDLEAFLADQIVSRAPFGAPFQLALALFLKASDRRDEAIVQLRRLLEERPHFWEARKELGTLLLAGNRSEDLRAEYKDILSTLGQPATGFACRACGQKLPEHIFKCPSCESWDTVGRET